MHSTSIKKIIAGVAAVATAAMGLALAAPAANAADPSTPNVGNINPDTKGTLTIEKHKLTATPGPSNDGTKQNNVPGDLMSGVTFNVYKVSGVDLSTSADWDKLSAVWNGDTDVSRDGNTIKIGSTTVGTITYGTPTYTGETKANGQLQFPNVPLGLYYVEEGGYTGQGQILSKANPFLVTMPYPVKNKTWNYDVWVYPKNSFGTTTKKVDPTSVDKTLQVGDDVSWDVDQNVPAVTTDHPLTSFGIIDQLDPHVTYKSVTVTAIDSNGNELDPAVEYPSTDYKVTYYDSNRAVTTDPTKAAYVGIAFNDPASIANRTAIRFKITTTVSKSLADPTVENHVFPVINNYNPFHTTGSTPPVNSKNQPFYGDFAFQKVDDQTPAAALNGAHFKIWRKGSGACSNTAPTDALEAVSGTSDNLGNTVSVDGKVVFRGVYIDTVDVTGGVPSTSAQLANIKHDFCLLETQAPAGYVTPTTAMQISLHAGRNADNPEQINTHDPITNTKQHGPKLPLTGAAGRLLLILGAIAILAAAAALYAVNKRRQNANANR